MNNNEIQKRPVTPVLRAMQIGQEEIYPASQLDSINTIISKLYIKEGKKYSYKTKDRKVIVKRIELKK